jgi:hypothetical protein
MFTYELDIDMKQEFQMGFDTEAHQLDTMILKCYMYNEGVPLDTTNYNVEFRAKKPDGTDYIQRKYGIEKGIGYININCTDELTVISGMCKAELRIWNGTLQQSTSRIINIGIIPSVLEVDRTISKSTITELQYVNSTLDSLNESLEEAEVFVSQHGDIVNLDSRVSNIEIDSTRTTISKAVTGAINELNANKANQSDLDNTNNNVSLKANATQVYTKNETDSIATNLRSKNTQITMNDLAQDVKTAMTGGNVAVVGEGAVQTINVIDKAITSVKRTVLGEFAQISTKSTPVAISETNKTLTFVDTSFNVLSYRNTNVFIPANTSIDITGNNSSALTIFEYLCKNEFIPLLIIPVPLTP